MTYHFSAASETRLSTCHPELRRLFGEVIKHYDCAVVCGARSLEEQAKALAEGKSKLGPGQSLHNRAPSEAVDVVPCPVDWQDRERFVHFAGFVLGVAAGLGIPLRWGGDWKGDHNLIDNRFADLDHFELVLSK